MAWHDVYHKFSCEIRLGLFVWCRAGIGTGDWDWDWGSPFACDGVMMVTWQGFTC